MADKPLMQLGEELQDALSKGNIPLDAEIIIGRLLQWGRSLQKIADLPTVRDGGRQDPNLRACRIALAAIGGPHNDPKFNEPAN